MAIPFDRSLDAPYGENIRVSPMITRVLANNPSAFTFKGTGVYIVGERDVAVIDPGPLLADHIAALKRALAGRRVSHILVTHTHSDHSPAAQPLKEWSGAKTYAFGPHGSGHHEGGPRVEEGGDQTFKPDVRVADGEILSGPGWSFECVHTPGHTSNHVCFALREEKALFTGDHIMGWSTTVVSPPDGDMAAYLASLDKVQTRNFATLWPTHGPPVREVQPFVEAYRAHRLDREAQILDQLRAGRTRIMDMVPVMYAGVDQRLYPAAAHSVLAHLIMLVNNGRVGSEGAPGIMSDYSLPA